MYIQDDISIENLQEPLNRLWELSGETINLIRRKYDTSQGSPVFTISAAEGWTEWTQGFQFGSEILQFDATGEEGQYGQRKLCWPLNMAYPTNLLSLRINFLRGKYNIFAIL